MEDNTYTRIAIIDHDTHQLFIEDISNELLQREYDGEEQYYIDANYALTNYSWDYIAETFYATDDDLDFIPVHFENMA